MSIEWDNASLDGTAKGPLHQQLREDIRARIDRGDLAPGDLLPPEVDLARSYGVSRTTIRRALLDLTQEGLLHRVPGQGTSVQRQRRTAIQAVALVCPFVHWYMLDVIDGITSEVRARGYELIVRNTGKDAELEAAQISELIDMAVSGIVLWPKTPDFDTAPSEAVRSLVEGRVPTVIVDQYTPQADTVTTDNFGGAYVMGQHLISCGYTRIGFITNHAQLPYTVHARWEGLLEALRNQGKSTDSQLLFQQWGNQAAWESWFARMHPEALFCANDFIALEVLGALSRLSVKVPDDIAVAGYDDLPLASSLHPPLTTVRQDFRALGQSAGRLLLRRIAEPSLPPRHIVLPVQLQQRSSCGASLPVRS